MKSDLLISYYSATVCNGHTSHECWCLFFCMAARFTFSAKEKDAETGFSYFGSRHYSSDLSIWLSVDPMSDKYPSLSPYVYCADNPVKLVDPDGEEVIEDKPPGKLSNFLNNLDHKVVGSSDNRKGEGHSDGANQGVVTKQDVEVATSVIATMVTMGAGMEAEGIGAAVVSGIAAVNNVDDATVDTDGQTFLQRETEDKPAVNNAVNVSKTVSPALSIVSSANTIVKNGMKKAANNIADVAISSYSFVKSLFHKKKSNDKSQ